MTKKRPIIAALKDAAKGKISPLREAGSKAPEGMGCYIMMVDDVCVYVGKAESGLRARLSSHYNKVPDRNSSDSEKQIYDYREDITVVWIPLNTKEECVRIEKKLIQDLKPKWNQLLFK